MSRDASRSSIMEGQGLFEQHWRAAHIAGRELRRLDRQCLLTNSDVHLAPDAPFRAALRAFHSFSPSTLIPVLSIKRCNAFRDPRKGMLTFRGSWRLKFGTTQSRLISRSWFLTIPVVRRSAMQNSTFMVRQVWIAASL